MYWVPAVVWSVILVILSGTPGRGNVTETVLQATIEATVGSVSDETFWVLHYAMRKTLHLLAYGLAGVLNFRALRGSREGWTLKWSVTAVALAVLIASIDEIHQWFVPSRTGQFTDVLIDCAAATLAQIFIRELNDVPETSEQAS